MFMKRWEEKTTVSEISYQCTSFKITKKYIFLFKNSEKQRTQALVSYNLLFLKIYCFSNEHTEFKEQKGACLIFQKSYEKANDHEA